MTNSPDNVVPITTQARSAAQKFGAEHDRELLTILFTDLVDSTRLQSELGNAEAARLTELHREIVRDELAKYDAREIEWAGDSCLAVFTKPSDGVAFALRLQAALREARKPEPKMPLVRIGLHLGEIVVRHHEDGGKRTEDLFGLQVSEAARVMSLARGDQIYCTRAVFENARSSLKGRRIDGVADLQWREHGNFELKGSENLVDVCEVGDAAHAPLTAPESNDKCRPYRGDPAKWRERRARAGQPRRGIPAATLILVIAVSAILGAALMRLAYEPAPSSTPGAAQAPVRFIIQPPQDAPLAGRESSGSEVAISPDGRTLVYVALEKGASRLHRRDLDSLEPPKPIPGTEGGREPRFSSGDGTLLFTKRNPNVFLSLSLEGGEPVVLAERDTEISGQLAILPDGNLIYSKAYGKGMRLGRRGSREVETLTTVDRTRHELAHMDPELLPGGDAFLFFATVSSGSEQNRVEAFSLRSRERKVLIHGGTQARYSPTGHILYASAGKLMAAPFDASTLEVTGPSFLVLSGIVTRIGGIADFDLSKEGTLIYVPSESSTSGSILAWVNLDGTVEPIPVGTRVFRDPALSPDGRQVAVAVGEGGVFDIWLFDVARGAGRRLTSAPGNETHPIWHPDGDRIVYARGFGGEGLAVTSLSDSNQKIDLKPKVEPGTKLFPNDWLQNDDVVFQTGTSGIWTVPETAETVVELVTSPGSSQATVSPDGRWLVYDSRESGPSEAYIRDLETDTTIPVSIGGGANPLWAPDGGSIYYTKEQKMMRVNVENAETMQLGRPEVIFDLPFQSDDWRSYDIAPDGTRFLMAFANNQSGRGSKIVVVKNFFGELERLAPRTD